MCPEHASKNVRFGCACPYSSGAAGAAGAAAPQVGVESPEHPADCAQSPRGLGGAVPSVVAGLPALQRFVFVRPFREAPLMLPPGFARLGATLQQLTVEGANWEVLPREVRDPKRRRLLECAHTQEWLHPKLKPAFFLFFILEPDSELMLPCSYYGIEGSAGSALKSCGSFTN